MTTISIVAAFASSLGDKGNSASVNNDLHDEV